MMEENQQAIVRPQRSAQEIKQLGERIVGPTPDEIDEAEEVMTDKVAAKPVPDELEHIREEIPFPDPPEEVKVPFISEKQTKYLWVMCKNAKLSETLFKKHIRECYGAGSSREIPKDKMEEVLAWIQDSKPRSSDPDVPF
jgi:hypothetical protein